MSTPIYDEVVRRSDAGELASDGELTRKIWSGTPWIIDVYLGEWEEVEYNQQSDLYAWCREHLGDEAFPHGGRPGRWHTGGAIINGWIWIGFDTEDAMQRFENAWPDNVKKWKRPDAQST